MVCYFPMKAYKSQARNPKSGKYGMTFSGTKALVEGGLVSLPCGLCVGCRISRAEGWAIRSTHEAQITRLEGRGSCFVTLTYDREHLPPDGSLRKSELQNFMKRLRQAIAPLKVRFLGCGEYGSRRGRAHFHLIIFGYDFPDRTLWRTTGKGERVYISEQLKALWPYGFHEVGSVTYSSARYVASYVMKKITGKPAEDHYTRVSEVTGEITQVEPEFQLMSLKPGLGRSWFERFKGDVFPADSVVLEGKLRQVPRYYEQQLSEDELETLKRQRRRLSMLRPEDRTKARMMIRAELKDLNELRFSREVD